MDLAPPFPLSAHSIEARSALPNLKRRFCFFSAMSCSFPFDRPPSDLLSIMDSRTQPCVFSSVWEKRQSVLINLLIN